MGVAAAVPPAAAPDEAVSPVVAVPAADVSVVAALVAGAVAVSAPDAVLVASIAEVAVAADSPAADVPTSVAGAAVCSVAPAGVAAFDALPVAGGLPQATILSSNPSSITSRPMCLHAITAFSNTKKPLRKDAAARLPEASLRWC